MCHRALVATPVDGVLCLAVTPWDLRQVRSTNNIASWGEGSNGDTVAPWRMHLANDMSLGRRFANDVAPWNKDGVVR